MSFLRWFSGGTTQYHDLVHCMMGDTFWITLTILLDLAVASGYAVIAVHWWKNQRNLPNTPARKALATMRNIFIFCAACGYIFIPVKMFWPAWRLYDIAMAALVYFTWKYALGAKSLKVIYNELGRSQRLQHDLEESREESRRKTFFLNALSHDLRTPLNGLMLQAEVARVRAEDKDDAGLRESLVEIEQGARAAAELVDSLLQCAQLDFVREANHIEEFALKDAILAATRTATFDAERKGLSFQCDCSDSLCIRADRLQIERIISNLANNAVKFTTRGSVRVTSDSAGENLEIHIIDTGPGISREEQPRVFEEFYQVENHERDRNKGFGLGLAIARRLARQLGGDIELQSSPGAGSRFTLLLPGLVVSRAGDRSTAIAQPAVAVAVG